MEEVFEDGLEIIFQWLFSLSGLSNFVSPQSSSLSRSLVLLHGKKSVFSSRLLYSFVRLLGGLYQPPQTHSLFSHQTSHVPILQVRATFLSCFYDLLISCLLTAAMACIPSPLPWWSLALPSINSHDILILSLAPLCVWWRSLIKRWSYHPRVSIVVKRPHDHKNSYTGKHLIRAGL